MSKKILAIGDINVDLMMGGLTSLPVVDREITCESFELTMGSSAVLFACAYARLGGDVSFLGLAGSDDYGDFMLRGMAEAGVRTDLVRRTNRVRTGITVNLVYRSTRSQITYPGTIAAFSAEESDLSSVRAFDHVHLAGPYQQTAFRPSITSLLDAARRGGASTSLDPQWDQTECWEYMNDWLPLLSYLFVNADEARSISKTDSLAAASAWFEARTRSAVIKMGAEGALFREAGTTTVVPSPRVEVVDTTGAGDTFDAAFLFAVLERQTSLLDAVRVATAAAARSCTFVGGASARSTWDDVMRFVDDGNNPRWER